MQFITYHREDGRAQPAVIEGDRVRPIAQPSLQAYIALAPHERLAYLEDTTLARTDIKLDAPVRPLRNVFCVGRNYLEHAKEGARAAGRELKLPDVPTFFTKAPTAIAAPDATVHFERAVSREYDYEAELAVIIGARCKDVSEAEAYDVVFGYTCLNDLTARDLQRSHVQWFKGKSLDESAPLGPVIVSHDEIGDPHALDISLSVNGTEKQRSTTANMIFKIPRLIAELSRGMTLLPGDVIATGTPEGVGFARTPPEFLADGDDVAIEISRIGVLRNRISIS